MTGFKKFLNVLFFALMIVTNVFANMLPLNGKTTGEISNKFPILFTPPGFIFYIWGVIYLGLLGYTIYHVLPKQRYNRCVPKIGSLYAFTSILNIAWIFSWHYEYFSLSFGIMIALLIVLIVIYSKLDIGNSRISTSDKIFINIPFSIYLAWICIASIGNLNVFLYNLGYKEFFVGQENWTNLMLLISGVLAILIVLIRKDIPFGLVFIWALIGVGLKNQDIMFIKYISWGLAGAVVISIIISIVNRRRKRKKYMFL